jgi:ABC-type nitrate/sulfonate/bicarbonate transport system substrate-binding protein
MKRRDFMTAAGTAALLAPLLGRARAAFAQGVTVRQGYQTNMWGMATYYLLRSGAPEKQGLKFEEFAVPSGNLTMQQMVGRQVDLGTYAGPSFVLGNARGGLVAIAQIEEVGKTVRIMARKELGIQRVEDLRGKKIADQVGSSISNVFVDTIAPKHGLKKGDWQEVRMNVNDMVAAMAAKTVDAMINVEPYNAIAEAEGLATTVMDYWDVDRMPVFMAATPDFVQAHPDETVRYLKAWLAVADDFKSNKKKVSDTIYGFYKSKGYKMAPETFEKAIDTVAVNPVFPADLSKYMQTQAEILLREKKIKQIPDWSKALRPEFMQKAKA